MKRILALAVFLILLLFNPGAEAVANDNSLLHIQKIDKNQFPKLKLHLSLKSKSKVNWFKLWENSRMIKKFTVVSKSSKEPVAVTLLIDTSGSMLGKPLDDAKAAALLFIEQAQPNDRISLIAFNSTVTRLVDFTSDKKKLSQAIEGLEAKGETAVYNGLLEGLEGARNQKTANQNLILLSDGKDTASVASKETLEEIAVKAKIPISVVMLKTPEFNPQPIADIARRSGGQLLMAMSSSALKDLYNGLAAELHNKYLLSYTSKAQSGKAKIEIEANVGKSFLKTKTTLTNLPATKRVSVRSVTNQYFKRVNELGNPWLAAFLSFLAAFLLVTALGHLLLPQQNILADQLKYYDQLKGRQVSNKEKLGIEALHKVLVNNAKHLASKYDFTAYAKTKLEQAGLPVKLEEYMVMHVLVVVVLSLIVLLLTGSKTMVFLFILIAAAAPLVALQIKIDRRNAAFHQQLPDTLEIIASSMRAGYGLQQAILAAGRETRPPTSVELTRVSAQVQMGMPMEDALNRLSERVGSSSFKWVVLAIAIHRETGGNLAEILDNLASSLRQRETMKRQIKALTAEGRLSALILIILPFFEVMILSYVNPGYMALLITTRPGLVMLFMALALMVIGGVWLKSITNIDY